MKVKLLTKYSVGYFPTSRCRKLQYKDEEEYIEVDIKEASKTALKPAFNTGILIYLYNNRLWAKATERDIHCCENSNNPMTAIEALIYSGVTYSTYFGKYKNCSYNECDKEQREDVIARAEKDMNDYLVVDGLLYKTTSEPRYCIYTFGLGHNHGGSCLSIDSHYNSNISKNRYFNALERDKAITEAKRIATARGDNESIERMNDVNIEVLIPEAVHCNPQLEHGEGDPFINNLEAITESSSSANEAGLLAMCILGSELSNSR